MFDNQMLFRGTEEERRRRGAADESAGAEAAGDGPLLKGGVD